MCWGTQFWLIASLPGRQAIPWEAKRTSALDQSAGPRAESCYPSTRILSMYGLYTDIYLHNLIYKWDVCGLGLEELSLGRCTIHGVIGLKQLEVASGLLPSNMSTIQPEQNSHPPWLKTIYPEERAWHICPLISLWHTHRVGPGAFDTFNFRSPREKNRPSYGQNITKALLTSPKRIDNVLIVHPF